MRLHVDDDSRSRIAAYFDEWVSAYVAVIVTIAAIGTAVTLVSVAGQAKDIADNARRSAYDNRATALAACQRGNETRIATAVNLRRDIAVYRSDVAFGKSALRIPGVADSPLGDRFHDFIGAHRRAIEGKESTLAELKRINKDIAVPGRPLVADCARQFPLPAHRGDPLPVPIPTSPTG